MEGVDFLASMDSSIKMVQGCVKGHKLPEPTRLAHELAVKAKAEGKGRNQLS